MTERTQMGTIYFPEGKHRPTAEDLEFIAGMSETCFFQSVYPHHTVVVHGREIVGAIPKARIDSPVLVTAIFEALDAGDRIKRNLEEIGIDPGDCILIETGDPV